MRLVAAHARRTSSRDDSNPFWIASQSCCSFARNPAGGDDDAVGTGVAGSRSRDEGDASGETSWLMVGAGLSAGGGEAGAGVTGGDGGDAATRSGDGDG